MSLAKRERGQKQAWKGEEIGKGGLDKGRDIESQDLGREREAKYD